MNFHGARQKNWVFQICNILRCCGHEVTFALWTFQTCLTQVVGCEKRGKVDVFVSAEFACLSIKGVSQDSRQMTMLQIIRV